MEEVIKRDGLDMGWFGAHDDDTPVTGGNLLKTGNGTVVGAIGTSGRSPDDDEKVALAGVRHWEEHLRDKG